MNYHMSPPTSSLSPSVWISVCTSHAHTLYTVRTYSSEKTFQSLTLTCATSGSGNVSYEASSSQQQQQWWGKSLLCLDLMVVTVAVTKQRLCGVKQRHGMVSFWGCYQALKKMFCHCGMCWCDAMKGCCERDGSSHGAAPVRWSSRILSIRLFWRDKGGMRY